MVSENPKTLTKGEVEGLNAGVKEFDLESSVYDWAFLPDKLIEPRFPNFTGAVRGSVNSAILASRCSVQRHLEANGLTVVRRSQDQVQVAAVEPEHDLSGHSLKHGCGSPKCCSALESRS
jgi:hypothetical protein